MTQPYLIDVSLKKDEINLIILSLVMSGSDESMNSTSSADYFDIAAKLSDKIGLSSAYLRHYAAQYRKVASK
jgi:hypothetical protein